MTELVGVKINIKEKVSQNEINPNAEGVPYVTNEGVISNNKNVNPVAIIDNININRDLVIHPPNQKINMCRFRLFILFFTIIFLGFGCLIFLMSFYSCLTTDSSIVLLPCQYHNYVEPYRCCEKTNCQCQEAPANLTSCTDGFYNLTTLSECSDGNFCCQYDTHLCPYTYYEDCDCVNGVCQQCAIIGYQPCDPYCSKPINDRLCSNECGTCHQISTYYQYSLNNTIYNLTSSLTQTICSRDNEQCQVSWINTHLANNTNICGFDLNDLNRTVTLNPNNPPKDCFGGQKSQLTICGSILLWIVGIIGICLLFQPNRS